MVSNKLQGNGSQSCQMLKNQEGIKIRRMIILHSLKEHDIWWHF